VHYSVYIGVAFAALFGLAAPVLARRVSPPIATWLLSLGATVAAVSGAAALALLAMTLIGQNPTVASAGHWSIAALRHDDPVRWPVAIAALAVLAVSVVRCVWTVWRRVAAHRAAGRVNRAVADTGTDLVVLSAPNLDAYAMPGRPGRVYVTRGLLTLLTREESEVVLAHERSHLRHHHHWHRSVVLVASALNPLLASLPSTQRWLTERWADEDAARRTDRALVASALQRAAASGRRPIRPGAALAVGSDGVDARVAAMAADPPRLQLAMVATVGILVLIITVSVLATLDGITDEAHLFHLAVLGHYSHIEHLRHSLSEAALRALLPAGARQA
jgi:Zn-dependent protease with chaperone function